LPSVVCTSAAEPTKASAVPEPTLTVTVRLATVPLTRVSYGADAPPFGDVGLPLQA
jgi:hypothetical protein